MDEETDEFRGMFQATGLAYGRAGCEPRWSDLAFVYVATMQISGYRYNHSTLIPTVLQRWESWELGVWTPLQLEFCT